MFFIVAIMYSPKTQATAKHKHGGASEECDVIGELMGQYGKYQFLMTFLLSLFQVPNTFHIASSIYQVIALCTEFRKFYEVSRMFVV